MKKFFMRFCLVLFMIFAGMVVHFYMNPVAGPQYVECDDTGPEFPLANVTNADYGPGKEVYVDSDILTKPENQLIVLSKTGGENYLLVELADTPKERELGLMHRYRLDEGSGMLFVFDEVKDVNFWMKNTYISLDIIWLNEKGEVLGVHKNATPRSEALIPSYEPVKAALEVNAGAAEALGLSEDGGRVIHPVFEK